MSQKWLLFNSLRSYLHVWLAPTDIPVKPFIQKSPCTGQILKMIQTRINLLITKMQQRRCRLNIRKYFLAITLIKLKEQTAKWSWVIAITRDFPSLEIFRTMSMHPFSRDGLKIMQSVLPLFRTWTEWLIICMFYPK